jgi:hypothetical protein
MEVSLRSSPCTRLRFDTPSIEGLAADRVEVELGRGAQLDEGTPVDGACGFLLVVDPTRGREELRRMFQDGKAMLKPQPDRIYLAEGTLYPLSIFSVRLDAETPKARDSWESSGLPALLASLPGSEPGFTCSSVGCAGANQSLETEAAIPFEFHAKRPPDGRKLSSTWRRKVA